MKKQLLLAAAALLSAATAGATCWRVNPDPAAKAQFRSVADAMADLNVFPGDTLLLDPGMYGSIDVTQKNITLIGTGYLLGDNIKWKEIDESVTTQLTLREGCKAEGMHVRGTIYLYGNDCTVSRCKANKIYSGSTIDRATIERCLILEKLEGSLRNSTVKNNIVMGQLCDIDYSTIENNSIVGWRTYGNLIESKESTIRNNIVINYATGVNSDRVPNSNLYCINFGDKNIITSNVLSISAQYANKDYPNNHYVGATVQNTFLDEGSTDGRHMLLGTSAAKNAATHGGDCGAFGGATPYILSGLPAYMPHITEAVVPSKPTDGKITVKLKIETPDE